MIRDNVTFLSFFSCGGFPKKPFKSFETMILSQFEIEKIWKIYFQDKSLGFLLI